MDINSIYTVQQQIEMTKAMARARFYRNYVPSVEAATTYARDLAEIDRRAEEVVMAEQAARQVA